MNLVTGASGFLGGRLAQVLRAQGAPVRIILRQDRLPNHLADLGIEVVKCGLEDNSGLREAVRDVSRIFHCAGCSTDWAPWQTYFSTNVTGVKNLLEAARSERTLRRFVHVSTADVYGYPEIPCTEDQPPKDVGLPYNRTKVMGEKLVWDAGLAGMPITIFRPASIYGPRSKDFVAEVAKLLKQGSMMYVSHGTSMGGFVFVDDVVDALLGASESERAVGQAYNIAPERDSSWKEYCDAMAGALKEKRPWLSLPFSVAYGLGRASELAYSTLGISTRPLITRHAVRLVGQDQNFPVAKAKRDFGFRQAVDLTEGISRSVGWLRSLDAGEQVRRV
jgi:nucleoside-diphosphate-sugar epimerase